MTLYSTRENENGHVSGGGERLSKMEARRRFREGCGVAVTSVRSARSANEVLCDVLGFVEARCVENTSSAGDWTYAVRYQRGWRVVSQHNRWPYDGFEYRMSETPWPTFEMLCSACVEGVA